MRKKLGGGGGGVVMLSAGMAWARLIGVGPLVVVLCGLFVLVAALAFCNRNEPTRRSSP